MVRVVVVWVIVVRETVIMRRIRVIFRLSESAGRRGEVVRIDCAVAFGDVLAANLVIVFKAPAARTSRPP